MPFCGGMLVKKLLKASSPPAEAPRPTTKRVAAGSFSERGAVTRRAVDAASFLLAGAPLPPRDPLCFRCAIEWPPLAGAEKIPGHDLFAPISEHSGSYTPSGTENSSATALAMHRPLVLIVNPSEGSCR